MRNPHTHPSARHSILVVVVVAVVGLIVHAGGDKPGRADDAALREIRGVVQGPDGHPVAGATIVAGSMDADRPGHQVLTTNDEGRFAWEWPVGSPLLSLIAHKEGYAASELMIEDDPQFNARNIIIQLGQPDSFIATLIDGRGRPIAGANVRVEMLGQATEQPGGINTGLMRFRAELIKRSPLESIFVTTTNASGSFTFKAFPVGGGLKLWVTGPDGRSLRVRAATLGPDGRAMRVDSQSRKVDLVRRTLQDQGFVTAPAGEVTHLEAIPAAQVVGKIVSTLPGVGVAGLTARYRASYPPPPDRRRGNDRRGNDGAETLTDADGRFTFEGLNEGTVNVFVHGDGENKEWTYRAAQDVALVSGESVGVTLELIRGVEVEGTVVVQGTGAPVAGAQLGVYGPFRPRTGSMTTGSMTDARGRYHYRLPGGETYFYVMGPPAGFNKLPGDGSSRTIAIPEGAERFVVSPIELADPAAQGGRGPEVEKVRRLD